MQDFYQLTYQGRSLRLRQLALAALREYDLQVQRVRTITIETNGIFRVDTADGCKYIVRITDPSGCHDLDEIRAEIAWLQALRRDTDLGVPQPLPNRRGSLVTTVGVEGVPEARHCVLFTWVPGPDLADRLTPDNVYKLGRLSARLHDYSQGFALPPGARLRELDRVFPFSVPNFRYVEPVLIFEPQFAHLFSASNREVYRQAVDRIQQAHVRLYADSSGLRVIHYDLHQWNVKVYRGRIYALDFEDLMWGYPVQDIAITLYYFQANPERETLFDAFRCGYTSWVDWPERDPGQIEAFMAGRGIMLVNYLLFSQEIEDQEMALGYIERVAGRLRAFLEKA